MYQINLRIRMRPSRGFTIIEMMVVVGILGVLAGIILPAANLLSQAADTTQERGGARSVVAAWRNWSTDHSGRLLPGQLENSAPLPGSESPLFWNGTPIPDIARRRWIWRLTPYLDDPGHMLWAGSQQQFWENTIANAADQSNAVYVTTLHPSFGLNTDYLGGRQSASCDTWALSEYVQSQDDGARPFYAESLSQLRQPARLIAFASSRGPDPHQGNDDENEPTIEGYWRLSPPWKPASGGSAPRWVVSSNGTFQNPDPGTSPENTGGFLSTRHNERCLVAAPDGHVAMHPFGAMGDMQRWADAATNSEWAPSLP
ncbi:MAG: type II secretion system protein [Planctomycetes bacterium]|nr:type II secretion system protein [Planctomycetota bacterium]